MNTDRGEMAIRSERDSSWCGGVREDELMWDVSGDVWGGERGAGGDRGQGGGGEERKKRLRVLWKRSGLS